ncbi:MULTISPECIES: NAD(P)H-binding protein [Methylobacterium]|uniref:NAD(P)H-binding protein n=1 Tax=Methylobacterium TaxID=407 RepID=UPI0005BAF520|nr:MULTISPECIES: NAD(P)H-binding protein [Methylobacterium]MDH3030630.1 NAD(P)H-binding protein [Methylobacterium fujisawaense]SFV08072.1 Nucleoside-diphosphate-sugar epimerase [Methylobacterium sp. UNCCL125]
MRTALVLGATGGVGGAVTRAMLARGWHVTALVRDPSRAAAAWSAPVAPGWQAGDAMNRADVVRAAERTSVIVHAVNPPGYRGWDRLVLPMLDNTLAAAQEAGARIVLPGTIYNYDPTLAPVIDETTTQHPRGRKGAIRVEMEKRLAEAAPEVRSLVVRAGDFFGPGAGQSWFAQTLAKPPLTRIVNPATRDVGHAWAYLPDLAETIIHLLELPADRLLPCERLQFPGHYDADGRAMVAAVRRASGRTDLPERRFPWALMRALAPFGGFPREVMEVRPFWAHAMRLDGSRLMELLGDVPCTSLDTAVVDALRI